MAQQRTRAWRRAQRIRAGGDRSQNSIEVTSKKLMHPKRWYEVYFRRNKLRRAKQIGTIWPQREWDRLLKDGLKLKLLFVCSKNQWRSPTGERIFSDHPGVETRSAGTSRSAAHKITLGDIQWADMILVMEDKHEQRIRADFRQAVTHKPIHVLDIPDKYPLMDSELIELLYSAVGPLIANK